VLDRHPVGRARMDELVGADANGQLLVDGHAEAALAAGAEHGAGAEDVAELGDPATLGIWALLGHVAEVHLAAPRGLGHGHRDLVGAPDHVGAMLAAGREQDVDPGRLDGVEPGAGG
jgi:hypothetical protein